MTDTHADDDRIATPDDFLVTRNGDDELQPVTQPLPGVEESIRVVPLSMGDSNEYGDEEGRMDPNRLDAGTVAEILNNHWFDLRESDRELTGNDVEDDLIAFGKEALLTAIFRASGFDMQNALNRENLEMLNEIDDLGKLQQMQELASN